MGFIYRFVRPFLLALLIPAAVGAETATPVGVWLHQNGRIQVAITSCGDRLCGKIVWFKWPNDPQDQQPRLDLKNPDPALRARPLLGLTVLHDLRYTGENRWEGGKIYNPDDGETYSASMSIQDETTLHVQAYVVLPALGETQIWTRVR